MTATLPSVLLTGASGNIGYIVLEQLIAKGHVVTVVLRSFSKNKPFFDKKCAAAIAAGQLSFVEIADMTVPHVFDAPAATVDAIVHVATPLGTEDFLKSTIEPAWIIDENVLNAASKSPKVKRVIVTGSIVSVFHIGRDLAKDVTYSEKDFTEISLEDAVQAMGPAYIYSKVSSEKKAWEYVEKNKPKFDVVFLLVPSVTGRSPQPGFAPSKTHLGGIASIYRDIFDVEKIGASFPYFMDVDDVASYHVKALDFSAVPGNERYLFAAGKYSANWVANKVRAKHPELRSRIPDGGDGDNWPVPLARINTEKAGKVFGTNWKGWWESTEATVEDVLAYERAQAAAN